MPLQISRASCLRRLWLSSLSLWFPSQGFAVLHHPDEGGYLHQKSQWTLRCGYESLSHSLSFYFSFRRHRIILQSIAPTLGLCALPGISDSMKGTLKIFWMTAPGSCKQTLNPMHGKTISLFSLRSQWAASMMRQYLILQGATTGAAVWAQDNGWMLLKQYLLPLQSSRLD